MIRTIVYAAVLSTVALSAAHAEGVRVSLVGKSPEQVRTDIRTAAQAVCSREMGYETFPLDALQRCVKSTVQATYRKMEVAEAALARRNKLAQR
jgi:hypothetical protein